MRNFGRTASYPILLLLAVIALASGCASLDPHFEEPEVTLIHLEPLPIEGVEQRFEITLRILNPNDRDLSADGIDLILEVNGQRLGRGVSSEPFSIPELSDGTIKLIATTHLMDVLRQGLALQGADGKLDYRVKGRIRLENSIGWIRFTREGSLLPQSSSQ